MGNSTTWKQALLLAVVVAVGYLPSPSEGHGRLLDPPSRSSLWREDPRNPINYQDNELFCGGFNNQWNVQDGKCGICGDPYQGPRENEAGGKYANGIISRNYVEGQVIEVKVDLTAHHKGWFEFRICPNNDVSTPASQACLDQHLLPLATQPDVTRYQLPEGSSSGLFTLMLQLPQDLTCQQCVFQWKYHCGNNWGCDDTGTCGVGYAPEQEEFRGCADVTITDDGVTSSYEDTDDPTDSPTTTTTTNPTTTTPTAAAAAAETTTTTTASTTTTTTTTTTAPTTTTTQRSGGPSTCRAGPGPWAKVPGMDNWCLINCVRGYCPPSHCTCD